MNKEHNTWHYSGGDDRSITFRYEKQTYWFENFTRVMEAPDRRKAFLEYVGGDKWSVFRLLALLEFAVLVKIIDEEESNRIFENRATIFMAQSLI